MKILHVCETLVGGTGSYLNELLKLQRPAMGAGNVAALIPQQHKAHITALPETDLWTFDRPARKAGLPRLTLALIKTLRSFKPDIVHAHSTFAGAITRVVCFVMRVPVVYCPHGWATDMELPPFKRKLIERAESFLAKLCARVIAISQHEYARGRAMGIAGEKLAMVYNGIGATPPSFVPETWDDTRLKILFVGRFDRQKGVDILLEAVAPLSETVAVRLIGSPVVGSQTPDFSACPHVTSFGWQTETQVAAHMASCDAVVMPSRWEGFGLVAIEAMRLSKPVLAAKVGGLAEAVDDGKTGFLFPPSDPAALRALLTKLDKNTLAAMGPSSRNRFLSLFTSDKMHKSIQDVYASVFYETHAAAPTDLPAGDAHGEKQL